MKEQLIKVKRLSTVDINKALATVDNALRELFERVGALEDEDIDKMITDVMETKLEPIVQQMVDDILEERFDIDDLTDKVFEKVWEKLGRV